MSSKPPSDKWLNENNWNYEKQKSDKSEPNEVVYLPPERSFQGTFVSNEASKQQVGGACPASPPEAW